VSTKRWSIVWGLLAAACGSPACGPDFPNRLLDAGDAALLEAPGVSFRKEIGRISLANVPFRTLGSTNTYLEQSLEVELADLQAALERSAVPADRRDHILSHHAAERRKITADTNAAYALRPDPAAAPRFGTDPPVITEGLPAEFADYFRGSVSWHQGQVDAARAAWTQLLARPEADRHFKSTWAAFMLGRSREDDSRRRAIGYFQRVRALANEGFADSLGLAAASFGYEARLQIRDGRYPQAVELFLDQLASGDDQAMLSLHAAAALALERRNTDLRALAQNPRARRVVMAYVLSLPVDSGNRPEAHMDAPAREFVLRSLERIPRFATNAAARHRYRDPADRWLEAVEAANVRDVELAEQLVLAAYQVNQMDRAKRWLGVAARTPVAQWLRAKLALRDGRIDEGAALLAEVSRHFPEATAATNRPTAAGPQDSLSFGTEQGIFTWNFPPASYDPIGNRVFVGPGGYWWLGEWRTTSGERIQGELGVLYLARRQYAEALHALLPSGYWQDAAYVAERVLTLDELKDHVDRFWPASPTAAVESGDAETWRPPSPSDAASHNVRYLLARRLARVDRWTEARAYFPLPLQSRGDLLQQALATAHDNSLPADQRARAFFEAARMTRYEGMELLGTEVEPDWHIWSGEYEDGVTIASRATNVVVGQLVTSADEQRRAARQVPAVQQRFHYRWLAADLAWQAAQLMPNNSDETARVLCLGGTWLKNRDPKAADRFYKALVRRCRKTALGAEADCRRWLPPVDNEGRRPPPKKPTEPEDRAPTSEPEAASPAPPRAARAQPIGSFNRRKQRQQRNRIALFSRFQEPGGAALQRPPDTWAERQLGPT
jgi:tetratricopeptide (TPR) repeat protein